jgi:hypothetical protein
MADEQNFSVEATPSLQQLLEYFVSLLLSPGSLERFSDAVAKSVQIGATVAKGAEIHASSGLADKKESLADTGYDLARKGIAWALSKVVAHLLGIEPPEELFREGKIKPQDSAIGIALARTVMEGIAGEGGELQPGDEAATRFMGMLAHLTIQSWAEGIIVEEFSSLHGALHPIEEISRLGQDLIGGMGLNRLARVAMRPLAQTMVATPLDWKYKRTFHPNLLSEGEIIKAFARGDYTADDAAEELARLGYSARRQDMMVKSAARRLSVDDVQVLRRARVLERDYALQNLRDEGYDDVTANYLVTAAEERRYAGIRDDSLSTIMRAYSEREIDEGQLRTLMDGVVDDDIERDLHVNAAQRSRQFNVKHLSHGEVLECVELGVLAIPDYRRWLEREGYAPDDADALELRLRVRLQKEAKADDERKRLAAERAKAQADAAAARQKRLDELEAQRALHARGSIADLRRAVARGLIPLDRLAEVLRAEYDDDTVQMLLELAEQDRADFVAQQQRADEARKRAAQRNIDLGSLEQGVLHHILTVDAYSAAITERASRRPTCKSSRRHWRRNCRTRTRPRRSARAPNRTRKSSTLTSGGSSGSSGAASAQWRSTPHFWARSATTTHRSQAWSRCCRPTSPTTRPRGNCATRRGRNQPASTSRSSNSGAPCCSAAGPIKTSRRIWYARNTRQMPRRCSSPNCGATWPMLRPRGNSGRPQRGRQTLWTCRFLGSPRPRGSASSARTRTPSGSRRSVTPTTTSRSRWNYCCRKSPTSRRHARSNRGRCRRRRARVVAVGCCPRGQGRPRVGERLPRPRARSRLHGRRRRNPRRHARG